MKENVSVCFFLNTVYIVQQIQAAVHCFLLFNAEFYVSTRQSSGYIFHT